MSMIRPEAAEALQRWQGVASSAAMAAGGAWIAGLGGLFYGILGGAICAMGAGLALAAWRRMRFAQPVTDAGLVEVDEGQISYFGPETGGQVALSDLARIEILGLNGGAAWRLTQQDGHALSIPVAAKEAELLYDIFAALPGAKTEQFLAALRAPPPAAPRLLWSRAPAHDLSALGRP